MRTRIITAVAALCILAPILIFASVTVVGNITVLQLALAIVCAIGVWEALSCVGMAKTAFVSLPCIVLSVILILTVRNSLDNFAPIALLMLFYLLFSGVIAHKNDNINASKLLEAFGFVLYVTASFGALFVLYQRSAGILFPLIFIGAWVTDTMAYFTGVFFGRHKLIPEVSPKKTVEGAAGGTLFCILGFVIWGIIKGVSPTGLAVFGVLGLLCAVVSQLGDLCASLIKRQHGIKDYGKLFPGHGGVLDRFDSILAVSVLLYLVTELPLEELL